MKSIKVNLDSIEKVKNFANTIAACDGDFDLASERYVVDAKSIMGIFSLDLAKTLRLDIHDDAQYDTLAKKLSDFMVE